MKNKSLITFFIILIPIGFGTKFYSGIFAPWVNNSLSDVIYEIFWAIFLFLLFPKLKIIYNVLIIFLFTSVIEFTQLINTPLLNLIRSNFIGKSLLGNTFVWSDFFYYALGCTISYYILINQRKSYSSSK